MNTIPFFALVIETVDPCNLFAFMVASEHYHFVRVADLVGEEEAYGFNTIVSSVDVVAHDQPLIERRRTADLVHNSQ